MLEENKKMTHKEKLGKMFNDLQNKGIKKGECAPPVYNLLWSMGIEISPPHFSSFLSLFLFHGIFFGIIFGISLGAVVSLLDLQVGKLPLATKVLIFSIVGVVSGISFGLGMARYYRKQAKKYNLPLWSEYGNEK